MMTTKKMRNVGIAVVGALLVLGAGSFSEASAATVVKKAGPNATVRHAEPRPAVQQYRPVVQRHRASVQTHRPIVIAKTRRVAPVCGHSVVSFGFGHGIYGVTHFLAPAKRSACKVSYRHGHRGHSYYR